LLVGPRRSNPVGYKGVGPNEELFVEKINIMAANSPKPERITFTGEVENVENYLCAADVFVLPSRLEGFANVVAEAMASGLPAVLTPYQGLPQEFGMPGREFLLSSYEPEKLAESIAMLLDNQGMRKQLGIAARNWAEKKLDIEMSIDSYARLYRQLAITSKS
jgi:glycosyltransferase involved in cell wall biosynthesis